MSNMTREEAQRKIDELRETALQAIREAETIADDHGISFDFDVAYGMGGWYGSNEWKPSSQSC